MNLLGARELARHERRLQIHDANRDQLRHALAELLPAGQRVILFGSLTRRGAFHDLSDIDLALYKEPAGLNNWQDRRTHGAAHPST